MQRKEYYSVDEYIQDQPKATRVKLQELRECILSAVDIKDEKINYSIPAFCLIEKGKRDQQIMIAGYKSHVGFYPHPTTIEKFKSELKSFKQGKGSIQFPLNQPIPCELIKRMVKYRLSLL